MKKTQNVINVTEKKLRYDDYENCNMASYIFTALFTWYSYFTDQPYDVIHTGFRQVKCFPQTHYLIIHFFKVKIVLRRYFVTEDLAVLTQVC